MADSDTRDYDREEILERDDYTCQRCGFSTDGDGRPLEVAHKVPAASGGPGDPWNLRTLCVACHSKVDGWKVGDFGRNGRAARVASYIRDNVDVGDRTEFIAAFMELTAIESVDRAEAILEDRGFLR